MKKASSDSFDAHIADLKTQIAGTESLSVFLTNLKEASQKRADAIDADKNPIPWAIASLQTQNHDGALAMVGMVTVTLKEFVQLWEYHKLLSEYVDDALGETSNALRQDFLRKQAEMMERYEPIYQGIMKHLNGLKANKAKYQGGPGDI